MLLDKSGATSSEDLHLSAPVSGKLPTGIEFELEANRLILATARAAKFVRRGDLWRSQQQINVEVNRALLVLIEWHARLTRTAGNDIWYAGRHFETWADPRVVSAMPDLFARYNEVELQMALNSMIDLTEWLAMEIAESINKTFPNPGQSKALAWIRGLLAD